MIARERLWYSPLRFAYYIVRREVNYAFYGTYACNTRIVRYVGILRRLVVLIASDSNKTAFSFGSKRSFDSVKSIWNEKTHLKDVFLFTLILRSTSDFHCNFQCGVKRCFLNIVFRFVAEIRLFPRIVVQQIARKEKRIQFKSVIIANRLQSRRFHLIIKYAANG